MDHHWEVREAEEVFDLLDETLIELQTTLQRILRDREAELQAAAIALNVNNPVQNVNLPVQNVLNQLQAAPQGPILPVRQQPPAAPAQPQGAPPALQQGLPPLPPQGAAPPGPPQGAAAPAPPQAPQAQGGFPIFPAFD